MNMITLSVFCLISISFAVGQEMSEERDIYNSLWTKNLDQANKTLHLDFVRRMSAGDLPADRYVNFTIQDINYLVKVTDMLKNMSSSVTKPADLSKFFQGRYNSYKEFQDSMLNSFFLKDVSDIKPIPAMKKYLSDYETIMNTKEPIIFAVSLLPCSRLWGWLAEQVTMSKSNAYLAWKKANMGGHPEKHYKNLLNTHLNTKKLRSEAKRVFRKQMQNEHNFFASS